MKSRIVNHILFWLIYLLFENYVEFAWINSSFPNIPAPRIWWMALKGESSQLLIKIPLCYLIAWLIQSLSARRLHAVMVMIGTVTAIGIAIVLHRVLTLFFIAHYIYHDEPSAERLLDIKRVISSALDLLFAVGTFVAIEQYRLYRSARDNERLLVKEKLAAELRFLKSQTNPHFLFNTLNNIYTLSRRKADETPDVIMKLSKLLRFMLYESGSDRIAISEELRVMNDYIELERIRYEDRLQVRVNKCIDDESEPIAPLILLPFVENAFKHGASETRFDSRIDIDVSITKGQLTFVVSNSKDETTEESGSATIGLRNVKRQLELMYPQHNLIIENGAAEFRICLNINLNANATISMPDR